MLSILRYYNTIKFLTGKQLKYRSSYTIRKLWRKLTFFQYPLAANAAGNYFAAQYPVFKVDQLVEEEGNIEFTFLNKTKHWNRAAINWSFMEFGLLWNYNLNYFEFLNRGNCTEATGKFLIQNFINNLLHNRHGLEPYPLTLRCMNWIKFFCRKKISDPGFDASLYAQYSILLDNLEYHLQHNHLLDNAFSLFLGGKYFNDEKLLFTGKKIIEKELDVQIFPDGAHFELSPMYHSIMLEHLLDVINTEINNAFGSDPAFLHKCYIKALEMLGWLNRFAFSNNDLPYVNDSAPDIAIPVKQLNAYANLLNLSVVTDSRPPSSAYHKWDLQDLEFFFDAGPLAVSYQAGHAHADTFSFIVYKAGQPVVVDSGISTYEKNARREFERSTKAHNTVAYDDMDSSEVWDVFRTGRRADTTCISESDFQYISSHNGYRRSGVTHIRSFSRMESGVCISDEMRGNVSKPSYSYIHFHPDIGVTLTDNKLTTELLIIKLKGFEKLELLDCFIAKGFNTIVPAKVFRGTFRHTSSIGISFA